MKAFQPGATKGKLAFLFTIAEIGAESRGKPVAALAIESCDTIWSDDKSALLFATAKPPTVGTDSHIGVLFLLVHQRDGWRIDDCVLRQLGKTQDLPQLTASAAIAHQLGSEGFDPVIMVNKHQGGRGYAYEICASYEIAGSKLKRFDLE